MAKTLVPLKIGQILEVWNDVPWKVISAADPAEYNWDHFVVVKAEDHTRPLTHTSLLQNCRWPGWIPSRLKDCPYCKGQGSVRSSLNGRYGQCRICEGDRKDLNEFQIELIPLPDMSRGERLKLRTL